MTEEEVEEAALNSVDNFGPVSDMFHPDYGWILKDGQPTKEGLKFFKDQRDKSEWEKDYGSKI